ncbi:hypothetical protein [Leptolyngbya sp. FACHB-261]|uniref:hypothetical protein n=1 Tax=Leptolyngbya sp. FACHB-261 TaxID=2692806 RepID=UPI0016896FFA|nr:hypothetical protein [Leptolyngbya sp. FACHB-261]MBD2104993.1 hypothetical protein [Leptolyngbya sp. FACHB-261]
MPLTASPSEVTLHSLPAIVREQQLQPFNFYLEGALQKGIRHEGELYGLAHEFSLQSRLQAYHLAYGLAVKGVPVMITISETRYAVWVSLRSPIYQNLQAILQRQSAQLAA